MDIVTQCLSLVPLPGLAAAFEIFVYIVENIQQVKESTKQLLALESSIAELLLVLHKEEKAGRLSSGQQAEPLRRLLRLLQEIQHFVVHERRRSFLKSMFTKSDRLSKITAYHHEICALVNAFQIASLIDLRAWADKFKDVQREDHNDLLRRLNTLQRQTDRLLDIIDEALNHHHGIPVSRARWTGSSYTPIIASLQFHLEDKSLERHEKEFYSRALEEVTVLSGSTGFKPESWMITSLDVDFGRRIGRGAFGNVFQGTWKQTLVAIKVLTNGAGGVPSEYSIRKEAELWSKLRHPHILQFLGANVLDDHPFIVTPYLKNGNVRAYLTSHPQCDRLLISRQIILGLGYLHSVKVVHGDLKAVNVLIDDAGNAVLCDFGLSRIKADADSQTGPSRISSIVGSRNWMAPEKLRGESARAPSDVYAYGMTLYEIYTGDIPLNDVAPQDFLELVVNQDVRPQRPPSHEAPYLTEEIWKLTQMCWQGQASKRPDVSHIGKILDNIKRSMSTMSPHIRRPALTTVVIKSTYSNKRSSRPTANRSSPISSSPVLPSQTRWLSRGFSLMGHKRAVQCVRLSRDYKWIASGSDDGRVCLWNTLTERVKQLNDKGVSGSVGAVDFSPDGKRLLSCHEGTQAICIWDVESGQLTAGPFLLDTNSHTTVCGRQTPTPVATFSPDGKHIAVGGTDNLVHLLNSVTGVYLRTYHHTKRSVMSRATKRWAMGITCLAFCPDGRKIASGSAYDTVCIWNKSTGELLMTLTHHHSINSVVFAADGRTIATTSVDQRSRVWNVTSGALLCSFVIPARKKGIAEGWPGAVCVDFSPDGQKIATGSSDGMIYVHDIHSHALLTSLDWHVERTQEKPQIRIAQVVFSVQFSTDGTRIISGGADKKIHIGYWRKSQRA